MINNKQKALIAGLILSLEKKGYTIYWSSPKRALLEFSFLNTTETEIIKRIIGKYDEPEQLEAITSCLTCAYEKFNRNLFGEAYADRN